jgi:hypothetical protein
LTNDLVVQFHLASAYEALGRTEDAAAAYQRAIDLGVESDPRPQVALAQTAVERLSAGAATE